MKRLAIFCDGTWQKPGLKKQTNVVKLARMVCPECPEGVTQCVFYDPGVGTKRMMRLWGGAFGKGINGNIAQAYLFLCLNYEPGDEVYLFGFSRGAYTVRSLAGLIYCSGLLKREGIRSLEQAMSLYRDRDVRPGDEQAVRFRRAIGDRDGTGKAPGRIPIRFLGCWDTVGALGVPDIVPWLPIDKLWNRRYRFHDAVLNRSIAFAAHAVAVDEIRKPFDYSPMQTPEGGGPTVLRETWFPGGHGSVGGGSDRDTPLADGPLLWMKDLASGVGWGKHESMPTLFFNEEALPEEQRPKPDPLAPFDNRLRGIYYLTGRNRRKFSGISEFSQIHDSVIEKLAHDQDYVPEALDEISDYLGKEVERKKNAKKGMKKEK